MIEERVYFWHLKALGFCNRQMRVWCKQHGVSWRSLINDGIAVDTLLALDDSSMAHAAVEYARESGWSAVPAGNDDAVYGGCV